ncbi:MAG: hypothetical protein JWO97_2913 [Acidobacteria bacterium]|nr:hypothetical protein [Acidobacteriota bacterium]
MTVIPRLPANPWVWIDPNLLQLVGLGTTSDPYAQDGNHLRWFFGRLLGFPRSGFGLLRRPTPFDDFASLRRLLPLFGVQVTSRDELGDLSGKMLDSGLGISTASPFQYTAIPSDDDGPYLKLGMQPVELQVGPSSAYPAPHLGPTASDPAAYVVLTIYRRSKTGSVIAEGYYTSGGSEQFQDRTGVGPKLGSSFGIAEDTLEKRGGTSWLRSRSELHLSPDAVDRRHKNLGGGRTAGCTFFGGDSWARETLILSGGLLERIRIRGENAVLVEVRWLPSRSYAEADGWTVVDQYFLPLTNAPEIYPAWTPTPGAKIADQRLHEAPPRALPPWDNGAVPPPAATNAQIEADIHKRYLEPFKTVDEAMRTFLAGELAELKPQALIAIEETMTWMGDSPDAASGPVGLYRPFDFLYSAAADPQMARMLGLMATDRAASDESWDYVIGAFFPVAWLWWTLFPTEVAAAMAAASKEHALHDLHETVFNAFPAAREMNTRVTHDKWPTQNFPVISLATAIGPMKVPLPDAPHSVTATLHENPGNKVVQGEVEVAWETPAANIFEEPEKSRIFYAVRRKGDDGDVALNQKDDDSGVLLPIVPSGDALAIGLTKIVDRSVPAYGDYTWRVSGMDIWGRFSPFGDTGTAVVDLVAPLAPAKVTATFKESGVVITFDWTTFHAGESPDVVSFDVHLRQGQVAVADNQNAASWNVLEHAPGATTAPLRIDEATAAIASALPASVTASVATAAISAEEGGGTRYIITLTPVSSPFADDGFARVSATATARDGAGNVSPFATRAIAQRADAKPPEPVTMPPGPQFTSYPDAHGRAHYRVALSIPAAMTAQVLIASQNRLLAAGNIIDSDYGLLTDGERVLKLKELAVAHDSVFTPDHELPYPSNVTEHDLVLRGLERTWTVVMIRLTSATSVPASWPKSGDAFAVVAVRTAPVPRPPELIETRGGDRQVTFRIAPDATGATKRVRICRTRTKENATEIRMMKPVQEVDVSAAPIDGVVVIDPDLLPDVPYFYRAVALGDANTRSDATEIISVKAWSSAAPSAPVIASVTKPAASPSQREVVFTLPRRDYRVTVLRHDSEAPGWSLIDADLPPLGNVNLAAQTVVAIADGYEVTLHDTVPNEAATYAYRIRLTDPRDKTVESAIVKEPS